MAPTYPPDGKLAREIKLAKVAHDAAYRGTNSSAVAAEVSAAHGRHLYELHLLLARHGEEEDEQQWRPASEAPSGVPVYVWPVGYSGIARRYGDGWLVGAFGSVDLDTVPTHYRAIGSGPITLGGIV